MLSRAFAPAMLGIDGRLVEIECDITNGLPGFVVVGLADKAVDEARERVRSAIKNSGLHIPPKRLTLNLAPADLPKDGSGYDLGMAMAVLAASGQIDSSSLEDCLFLGELGLDGSIRPVKGAILAAQLTSDANLGRLFVSPGNAHEAGLLGATSVIAVSSLLELFQHLCGLAPLAPVAAPPAKQTLRANPIVDLATVYGQPQAKRAIEIAAAGNHNILMSGPPGTGKTLLAKAITGLLPDPSYDELIEITKIYSLAGLGTGGIAHGRPFRAPHHTASSTALIGGGTKPRPGEISLSHNGVLFLDEIPEFPRSVLEVLRQPLEEGFITIARAAAVITYPASFMLVATRNPCPCGYHGDDTRTCTCSDAAVSRYRNRLSGPLLDRIDLAIDVNRVENRAIISAKPAESSRAAASRVLKARLLQQQRLERLSTNTNNRMSSAEIQLHCKINNETTQLASHAMRNLGLSARGYTRTLKVARTIADLDGAPTISVAHFAEALQYRPR